MDGMIGSMVSDQMQGAASGQAADDAAQAASVAQNESAAGAAADESAEHADTAPAPGTGATSAQMSTMPAVNAPGPASTQATQLPAPQTYAQSMGSGGVAPGAQAPSGSAGAVNPVKGDTSGFETGFNTMFNDEFKASQADASSMSNAMMMSDRSAKTDVKDATADVDRALGSLSPKSFDYRDPARDGGGRQVGVMAQDLQRAGLGGAVSQSQNGLVVDARKLAAFSVASNVVLAQRVKQLESLTAGLKAKTKGGSK